MKTTSHSIAQDARRMRVGRGFRMGGGGVKPLSRRKRAWALHGGVCATLAQGCAPREIKEQKGRDDPRTKRGGRRVVIGWRQTGGGRLARSGKVSAAVGTSALPAGRFPLRSERPRSQREGFRCGWNASAASGKVSITVVSHKFCDLTQKQQLNA